MLSSLVSIGTIGTKLPFFDDDDHDDDDDDDDDEPIKRFKGTIKITK